MNYEQTLSVTDYRPSTGDHFSDEFSEKMVEDRKHAYINSILVIACVSLIALQFLG